MNRLIARTATLALVAVAALFATVPALAAPARTSHPAAVVHPDGGSCGIPVDFRFQARWDQFGDNSGPFGCPASNVYSVQGENGYHQLFDNGSAEMTWSPNQGNDMVVSGFTDHNGNVQFDWGSTLPFSYDDWLVSTQGLYGQWECSTNDSFCGTTGGTRLMTGVPLGTWVPTQVEGCDTPEPGAGDHTCNQGWTNAIFVQA